MTDPGGALGGAGRIFALLGPTNTGKTHHAVERLLAHRTGIIGVPLRLLAREVYGRLVAATGPEHVALLTGEERIQPPRARYAVATTESMPMDRDVAVVVVDEVQLAADPARGHVFTDRILRARGLVETWFLGAASIEPLLRELVPTVEIRAQPRLSDLRYAGHHRLDRLPPRAAVVAFRAASVYALADRLRAVHGGAAVVLGALSPRTRNAQVALFESGEVPVLVATDAIGMGLNLDVHHVALAETSKFDGAAFRALRDDELGQIAGRAGRFRRDGRFGTTADAEPLPDATVDAIEGHRYPVLRTLYWRPAELDFASVSALRASLGATPPRRFLRPAPRATDVAVLDALAARADVAATARGEAGVRRLWELAQIPDFAGVDVDHHADLLAGIHAGLVDGDGVLPAHVLASAVRRVQQGEADLERLMVRLAAVRTWTYVAHRPGWVDDAPGWIARLRDLEDTLSDALHQRLTARFVDASAGAGLRRRGAASGDVEVRPGGALWWSGRRLGALKGVDVALDPGVALDAPGRAAVMRAVRPALEAAAERLIAADDAAIDADVDGALRWGDARVGRLLPGDAVLRPRLVRVAADAIDGALRQRLDQRLDRWRAAWLQRPAAIVAAIGWSSTAGKALSFALLEGAGRVPREVASPAWRGLHRQERARLEAAGVVLGPTALVLPRLVDALPWRVTLWRLHHPTLPPPPDLRAPWRHPLSREAAAFLGLVRWGDGFARPDHVETIGALGLDAAAARLGLDPTAWAVTRAAVR